MSHPGPDEPRPRLPAQALAAVEQTLVPVDERWVELYPGEASRRQPVHTVYVPVDRIMAGLPAAWGADALQAVVEHAAEASTMAEVVGMDQELVADVWSKVMAKLEREPIEDLRADAEDGYRGRPEAEDSDVIAAGVGLAADVRAGNAPPFVGLRAKGLQAPVRTRGLRSLDLFLGALIDGVGGPSGLYATELRITLPKITDVIQVEAMVAVLTELESAYGLAAGQLGLELQVETPQAVLGADGRAALAPMVHAAGARCRGLHFGTYDYSASLGIAAAHQASDHPAADHAKASMQLAVAGTGAVAVDGSTNILPVGTRKDVHAGWRLHARLVRRALAAGFYQGWDLHPAQLVTRYLATYAFYREAMRPAAFRLRAYVSQQNGTLLDEPATAKALASVLIRGLDCGALSAGEVTEATGLDGAALDRLAGRAAR